MTTYCTYLGVVLGISRVQGDCLEVQAAVEIDCGHNVPLKFCDKPHRANQNHSGGYILQSRSNSTGSCIGTRRSYRSCGSHPISVCRLLAVGSRPLSLTSSSGWCQLVGCSGERQRSRRSEGLSLRRVRRVCLDAFHNWSWYR